MKHYSLEIREVERICECKKHIGGCCGNPKTIIEKVLRESYIGSFFYGAKTAKERFERMHKLVEYTDIIWGGKHDGF